MCKSALLAFMAGVLGGVSVFADSQSQSDSTIHDDSAVTIRIQSHAMRALPGAVDTISINISSAGEGIAGFDFTLAYDRETYELISALPGSFPESCNWEYFIVRDSPKCPAPCPSGLFKIVALARFKNVDSVGACLIPESEAELVKLILKRKSESGRRAFKGVNSEPLRFFWIDCGDNSVASASGNDLLVAGSVSEADGASLPVNTFDGFPNYTGPTSSCFDSRRSNSPKARLKLINALIVTPPIEYVPALDTARNGSRDSL
jgi:hypothetical protein